MDFRKIPKKSSTKNALIKQFQMNKNNSLFKK